MSFGELLSGIRAKVWSIEDRMELRLQIALATGVLCFMLVATLAVGAALVGRHDAVDVASDWLNDIAATLAERLDRTVAIRLTLVEYFASLHDDWSVDTGGLDHLLSTTRNALADTAWIGFATPDGTVVAADGRGFAGRSAADQDWFRRGLEGSVVIDGAALPVGVAASPGTGQSQPFLTMGVPVRDSDGKVVGVLGFYFDRAWGERLRSTTIADTDASQDIRVTLISRGGAYALDNIDSQLALSPDQIEEMFAAGSGVVPVVRDGYLTAFAVAGANTDSSRPTWLVVARQSASVAFQSANKVVDTIVILGLVVGLVGILGSMFIAERVSRPFRMLADKAALVGRDSTEMLPRVRGSFETARLSTALRALITRLTHAEQSSAEAELQLNLDIARLRSLAEVDPLTELLNRRAFLDLTKGAIEDYRRHRRPFAILMFDIDHFKSINDSLGHATGDTVIRTVAHAISGSLRDGGTCARFGGEEFIALLREVSTTEAIEVAERIRATVSALPLATGKHGDLFVTVSVGIALCEDSDTNTDEVISRADAALYVAKRDGRNRVAFAPPVATVRRIA